MVKEDYKKELLKLLDWRTVRHKADIDHVFYVLYGRIKTTSGLYPVVVAHIKQAKILEQ